MMIRFSLGAFFAGLTVSYGYIMRCALGTCTPYYDLTLFSLFTFILAIGFLVSGLVLLLKDTKLCKQEGIDASKLADNSDHHFI